MSARVRVAILTTRSVVTIQRIEPEANSARSVMCINRTSVEAGVSRDYNRFVRRGTGVIAKLTNTDAFRMDVDTEVTDGRSFELAVFLAHVLRKDDRLADPEAGASALWVATGEVDADHNVRSVDGIAQKLRTLDAWLASAPAGRPPVRLLLPRANQAQAKPDLLASLVQAGVTVDFVEKADVLPGATGRPDANPTAPIPGPPAGKPGGGVGLAAALVLAVVALGTGLVWWTMRPMGARTVPDTAITQPAAPPGGATNGTQPEQPASQPDATQPNGLPTVPAAASAEFEVVVRDTVSSANTCYGGDRRTTEHRAQSGGEVVLQVNNRRCRLEAGGRTPAGAALRLYLVGRNGQSFAPMDLGPNGSLTPKLITDETVLTIVGAPGALGASADVSRLPHVTIRIGPAPSGGGAPPN